MHDKSQLPGRHAQVESWPILRLWLTRRSTLERICLHWTRGCRSDAEDLLSEALKRALEAPPPPETVSSPRAWLTAIIANLGRDRWRRANHEVPVDPRQCHLDELTGGQMPCDDALDTRRKLVRFLGHGSGLSSVQRHVLIERGVGESYRNIARSLNMSESTARKVAQQARLLMRLNGAGAAET
jgi:DNA-directed RNA polymerase specialized sigma24 family protein